MTDEEIIKLAEKTKKEKFCIKFNNCWGCPLFKQYGQSSECIDSKYRGSFYTKFFIDGFKAATEYIEKIIEKSKTPDDGFAYSVIYNQVVNDIINKIKNLT